MVQFLSPSPNIPPSTADDPLDIGAKIYCCLGSPSLFQLFAVELFPVYAVGAML